MVGRITSLTHWRVRTVTVWCVNTTPVPDPVQLGQQIIDILEKGKKTSTYKLATLLALIEYSVERAPNPNDRIDVSLDVLAERIIERYWQQTRPLRWDDDEARPLCQSGQATTILDDISKFRTAARSRRSTRLDEAKRHAPDAYTATIKRVKRTLVRYPLALLQRVPGSTGSFLYDDKWMLNAGTTTIDRNDNKVELHEGVAYAMARLAGLMRPALDLDDIVNAAADTLSDIEHGRLNPGRRRDAHRRRLPRTVRHRGCRRLGPVVESSPR